jgi:hypothetical protein
MPRISEIERPGLAPRIAYCIGERMFGVVPTPERVMAGRGEIDVGVTTRETHRASLPD